MGWEEEEERRRRRGGEPHTLPVLHALLEEAVDLRGFRVCHTKNALNPAEEVSSDVCLQLPAGHGGQRSKVAGPGAPFVTGSAPARGRVFVQESQQVSRPA